MPKFKLLTVANPKIEKATRFGYLTAVLHLAPGSLSGFNVCPKATQGCLAACLNTAGRGGLATGGRLTYGDLLSGKTNRIQEARIRRTHWYHRDRVGFMEALSADIAKLVRWAASLGLKPAIRLNGTSDIPWERVPVGYVKPGLAGSYPNIMHMFPKVQFYDYTKRPNRRYLPSNYRLTFSLAEGNDGDALQALANGLNVAAVFHKVPQRMFKLAHKDGLEIGCAGLPTGNGVWEVIDGDEHDLRFLDPPGVIVGLKAKGNAKRDTSGFVR